MEMESDSGGEVEAMSTGQTRKPAVRVNYCFAVWFVGIPAFDIQFFLFFIFF